MNQFWLPPPAILSSIIRYFYNLYYLQLLSLCLADLSEVDVKWWVEKEKLGRVEVGGMVEVMKEALKDVPSSQVRVG